MRECFGISTVWFARARGDAIGATEAILQALAIDPLDANFRARAAGLWQR